MKNYKYIIPFILLIFGIISCEKDSNIDVPIVQPELVSACFLSPTVDGTRLYLTWSAPIFNTTVHEMPDEEHANVNISDGSNNYKAHYINGAGYYFIPKPMMEIKEGSKYSLSVTANKSKDLYAETIIPAKPIFDIAFQSLDSLHDPHGSPSAYNYTYFVNLNIKNPDSEAYYRISVTAKSYSSFGNNFVSLYPSGGENRIIRGDYSGILIMQRYGFSNERIKKIYVNLHKVDETYYRYHHALENYSGDDFFSEPTLIYSNVENGLGVFCSYNNKLDSVDVN